jgi:hypothetical protein
VSQCSLALHAGPALFVLSGTSSQARSTVADMTDGPLSGTSVQSFDVRAELESLVERDLLGPWDGPEEELPPGEVPDERYMLGRLVPAVVAAPIGKGTGRSGNGTRQALQVDESNHVDTTSAVDGNPDLVDLEITDAGGDIEEPEPAAAVRSGRMAASAIGVSFWVPSSVDKLTVQASWGCYERGPSETQFTEQGRPRVVWKRQPLMGTCRVDIATQGERRYVPVAERERVELRVTVRHRGPVRVLDLSLVNNQEELASNRGAARLYQVALTVTAEDGADAVFVGHNDPELSPLPSKTDDPERLQLDFLYRHRRRYAHGHQCAVEAEVRQGEVRAWLLRTTCFPAVDVPLAVPATAAAMPGVVLDMARLGSPELARDELVRGLRPLVTGYRIWLADQERKAAEDPEAERYKPAPAQLINQAAQVADRLDRVIDLLRDDPLAREAFRFANQAMALQRVRSEVVRARLQDPTRGLPGLLAELDRPERRRWRPFQLAFVLLCLPGLTDPTHPDAHRGIDDGEVELLFFPTGGGKTESYLGLAAYTFAIRRLQGLVGEGLEARDGSQGVAVLMRYTLRLLTTQQFQRAAALLCACEWLRRERVAGGDTRWGSTPFRVGLWVGSKVAPNTFEAAEQWAQDSQGSERGAGGPLQILACPWCGSSLSPQNVRTDKARRRLLIYCSDPEGDCPFTPNGSPGEGIPVVTVDEEIYRLTPALVIATVDKFALLPWRAASATLFGLVDQVCARHGWRNPDFDKFCPSRHQASGDLPAVQAQPAMHLRPPDLIIQDELHLITDALGSMVGLYELAIDRLCTRVQGGREVRPVVVASTATARRAADQVEKVFARGLTLFPPQVLNAGETFFSSLADPSPGTPGRRYRGLLATGERLSAVEIRTVASVMEHAQFLLDRYGAAADPYMTLVDYFSSTRELAGMRRLVDDDIAERLDSLRVRTKRRRPLVQELTSRMASDRIAVTLGELERAFDPAFDATAGQDAFREEYKSDREAALKRVEGRYQPIDVLLATSMLQVGVDVQRLGLMLVTGQPKNTAEYIQATSRIGRDAARPGVVFTLYHWSRPRDLAHFEDFCHYHSTFGARVEGLTTTPFSDRALDRGLTAVVVAAMRQSTTAALANVAAGTVDLGSPFVVALLDGAQWRAERVLHDQQAAADLRKRMVHRLEQWQSRRKHLATGRLGYETATDVTGLLRPPEDGSWGLWTAPRSLREVEEEIVLQLQKDDRSVPEAPAWAYPAEQAEVGP